jgi:site-specific recombinase XerD
MKESSMLTTYLKTPRTLEHYRSGLAGPHLDAFTGWLEAQRYQSRRIRHLLRGAHRFSCWAHSTGFSLQALDGQALEAYGHHLQEIKRLRYPSGRYSHLFVGARHLVRFLETRGVVAPATSILPPPSEPALLGTFRQWMQTHRGTTQATLNGYRLTITALLQTLGDQPECWTARALRAFVLERARQGGMGRAKTVVTAVRMFLRVLIAIGRCPPGLDHALPTIAHWRLATLPKYLPAETVERVLATCDLATPRGVRDRAVLLLLARLGFRAGDVAALQWRDIDWQDGTLCVVGKSRRATRLPLPQDVGEAMLTYLEYQRPRVPHTQVFLTTIAPLRPLRAKAVTAIAARALHRAQVDSPTHGAHVLRHSAATQMLRQGASLPSIGALLRHASVETTAHYAKVDVVLLQEVARPWPEVTPC